MQTISTVAAEREAEVKTIPVGNLHEPQVMNMHRRTPEQRDALLELIASEEFDYACHNPLESDVSPYYEGPFNFLYYTIADEFVLVRIGKTGKILQRCVNGVAT